MHRRGRSPGHPESSQPDPGDPKSWLRFVELDPFSPAWRRLGLGDVDLRSLQILICTAPTAGPLIVGTGGLRKLRFAPEHWHQGKRGAVRVYYAFFQSAGLVALIFAHAKSDAEALSASQRAQIKNLLREVERALETSNDRSHP
jgi:hypothetical protein